MRIGAVTARITDGDKLAAWRKSGIPTEVRVIVTTDVNDGWTGWVGNDREVKIALTIRIRIGHVHPSPGGTLVGGAEDARKMAVIQDADIYNVGGGAVMHCHLDLDVVCPDTVD